jgi:leucyl/phenylalanyl-tRNA--protein transferase
MIQLYQLDEQLYFPSVDLALSEPNGLLAFGGDLSVERLVSAYSQGVFPWFNQGEPILWWSPDPRAIIEFDDFNCSKSLAKLIRQQRYTVTLNHAFERVIQYCASIPRKSAEFELPETNVTTWITSQMLDAYKRLHQQGYAHSVEVWRENQLVGGLYGVSVGAGFAGESMFHIEPNTSKLALAYLIQHLRCHGIDFVDCQIENPHLVSLGCKSVSRQSFLNRLQIARTQMVSEELWLPQPINY